MDYAKALNILAPGSQWKLRGNSYEGITMLDATPKPSDAELIAAFNSFVPFKSYKTSDFWAKLSVEEQIAIVTSSDAQVTALRFTFSLYPTVETNNPLLVSGLNYLASIGILTASGVSGLLA